MENGQSPKGTEKVIVSNPAMKKAIGDITLADKADLDYAVISAKEAFDSFSIITFR